MSDSNDSEDELRAIVDREVKHNLFIFTASPAHVMHMSVIVTALVVGS
jgi:hypothetical protein